MDNKALLELARKRMADAVSADRENRENGMDDLAKLTGDQWPDDIRSAREAEGKPCLTINRLPQFVRQVTGDIRRLNPAINVTPADSNSDEDTAEIIEGLIRQIEYRSDASSVYEGATECAAAASIGWWRITHDWEDDESFDQEILIKAIRNPFSVYCDPDAQMPTREDATWLFITEQMSEDEFKEAYPGKSAVSAEYDGTTDGLENWRNSGTVVVAEYYWQEPVTKTLYQMADGSVIGEDDFVAPMNAVRKRKVDTHRVMWAKVSGTDVLEGPTEQASKSIPVIAVTGEEWHIGDRVHRSSVIRYAKDAQQMYNYWRSASTELVALQPKAPFVVTAKQVAGLERFWNEANSSNRPYLPYNADPAAPAPQRALPPVSSQGMLQEIASAAEDMKATTGIYDAGLGQRSNEQSGVAIRQRQMESDVSTSIYSDNMAKAIAHTGRIIIEMIPAIYDTKRVIRILGKDDTQKMVPVNDMQLAVGEQGLMQVPVNDLTVGKYDLRVSVGPNYSTRRQETQEGMLGFIQAFPMAAPVVGDLVAKAMDWPDADQFAERLKKTLPPGMIDQDDLSPEEQQAQMQAQQQQMQAQQAQMQAQQEAQAAQQAAFQIEMRKATAEATEAEADATKAGLEVMDTQLELAAKSGQLNDAVALLIQQEVARALQSVMGQQPRM